MPSLAANADLALDLRRRAVSRLAEPGGDGTRATPSQALAVLYELASSPATAADALAVLHELQVHQVELDLQHEELRRSRDEFEAALARQTALYERAPLACLTVDAAGVLHEGNPACARLLGVAHDELRGATLARFMSPRDADRLLTLMSRTRQGQEGERCELTLAAPDGATHAVQARAAADTAAGRCLLVLVDLGP